MRLPIDPSSPIPLYRQVAEALRAAIASGRLSSDSELPGVRELAADLRVNYHTIARAYQELEEAGLLTRQRGGPFRVGATARPTASEQRVREGLFGLAREALSQGLSPQSIAHWWSEALGEAAALSNKEAP